MAGTNPDPLKAFLGLILEFLAWGYLGSVMLTYMIKEPSAADAAMLALIAMVATRPQIISKDKG